MKKNFFHIMKTALIPAVLLSALLAAACGNVFVAPENDAAPARGMGIVRVSIGDKTAGGRTLMPDHQALYYVLTFTMGELTKTAYIDGNNTVSVELGEGNWALEAKGYLDQLEAENNPGYPVVRGTAEGGAVKIESGKTKDVTVILSPFPTDGGEGRLVFDLKFPGGLNQATLHVEPFLTEAGDHAEELDLDLLQPPYKTQNGGAGEADLAAGYYRVKYTMVSGGGRALKRSTVLHIYHNLDTPLEGTFTEADFTEPFVAVTGISYTPPVGLLTGAALDLTTAAAEPGGATNTDITWTLSPDDDGSTGVTGGSVNSGMLAPGAGTLKLRATVKGGKNDGTDYWRDFTIIIAERPVAAKPVANPASGAVTTAAQITLTTATEGAVIWYTTDASDPKTGNTKTQYTAPITLPQGNITLKAVAVKDGLTDSGVLETAYTVTLPKAETPAANPAGSAVNTAARITLTTATEGAVIWYTTDASDPKTGNTKAQYTAPITLPQGNITLKAVAVKDGWADSGVLTETYTVTAAGPVLTSDIEFYTANYSSATIFDDNGWTGRETAEQNWTLTAGEHNKVYFAVYKEAEQDITAGNAPGRTDADRVSVTKTGSVAGARIEGGQPADITANDTLWVFTVDTADLVFDGGDRVFTLEVSENGALPKTVTVTLNVAPNLSGAAVFKVNWPVTPATLYGDLDLTTLREGGVTLTRLGPLENDAVTGKPGFRQAVEYVDLNAMANTDYLIRVEDDALDLPRFYLTFMQQENVTLRLRGTKDGPWTLQNNNLRPNAPGGTSYNPSKATISLGNSASDGFFNIGNYNGGKSQALVLENNITVKGVGAGQPQSLAYRNLFKIWPTNVALVMKKGSKLTESVNTTTGSGRSIIYVPSLGTPQGDVLRIEGGSITDCSFDNIPDIYGSAAALIFFGEMQSNYGSGSFYKAAHSPENPVVISGNSSSLVIWKQAGPNNMGNDLGTRVDIGTGVEISEP
jgi:hypothetical protein